MKRTKQTTEQIIRKLKTVDVVFRVIEMTQPI